MLDWAGLPPQVGEYLVIRVLAEVIGIALGGAVSIRTGIPPVLGVGIGGMLGVLSPVLFVRHLQAARIRAIEPQLVELCELMASMLRSGFGYMQALSATMEQLGAPLSVELSRMLDR